MLPFLLTLPFLMLASALASASETALFSLTRTDRQALRERAPHAAAAVERLLARPRTLLIQVLLLNMVVNVTYFVITSVITLRADAPAVRVAISVGGVLAIILVGEVLAKLLASAMRRPFSTLIAAPMLALQGLLWPVLIVLDKGVIAPLSRLVHEPKHARGQHAPARELETLIDAAAHQGALSARERQLLREVVALSRIRVREVMTPRVDLEWLPESCTRAEVLETAARARQTTLPLCDDSPDAGVTALLDVNAYLADTRAGATPRDHARAPLFVPEQATLDGLLSQLTRRGEHIAIVVDELGAIAGVVEIEDIADEILSGLATPDEDASESAMMVALHEWIAPGRLPVRELVEMFPAAAHELDDVPTRVSTIAGLMQSRLGRLPHEGDSVRVGALEITVEGVEGLAIRTVRVRLVPPPETGQEDES
ncbi:MAG: hemolysin family protein [Phycisphaerales bacterium]